MSRFQRWRRDASNQGLLNWINYRYKLLSSSTQPFTVYAKQAKYPLLCRPGTSDPSVFHQIFLEREYAALEEVTAPTLIIDCGANVGYSSAYFLSVFPTAHVVAIEPESSNFGMLRRNLSVFGERVRMLQSAVWSKSCGLIIDKHSFRDGREWSTSVRAAQDGEAPDIMATDIATILGDTGLAEISILKIDIEGSEVEVFSSNYQSWINKVQTIAIELHDNECERVFFQALQDLPFKIKQYGEITVCRKSN